MRDVISRPQPESIGLLLWLGFSMISLGILAYLIAVQSPEDIYLAAILPILLLLLQVGFLTLRMPSRIMPLIILVAAAFIPLSLPTGTASRLVDSLALTIAFFVIWIFKKLIFEGGLSLYSSPVNSPLLLFIVVVIFSLIWSQVFRDPLVVIWDTFPLVQVASAVVMVMLPVVLLLVANTIDNERILKIMVFLMTLAGILGIVKHFIIDVIPVNVDGLFNMWVIAITASWAIFNRESRGLLRMLMISIVALWLLWSFWLNASWLAGWLPGVVVLTVLAWRRSPRLLFLFLLIFSIAIIFNTDYLERTLEAEIQTSLLTRIDAWRNNWRVTREHVLFGTGPGGYAAYYVSYFPTQAMATHNNYIDVIAQTGVLGLVPFLWFLGAILRLGLRVSRKLEGRGNFLESIGNAAFAGTAGAVVIAAFGDWLLPFAYTQGISGFDHAVYSWLFMGVLLVVDRLASNATDTPIEA